MHGQITHRTYLINRKLKKKKQKQIFRMILAIIMVEKIFIIPISLLIHQLNKLQTQSQMQII